MDWQFVITTVFKVIAPFTSELSCWYNFSSGLSFVSEVLCLVSAQIPAWKRLQILEWAHTGPTWVSAYNSWQLVRTLCLTADDSRQFEGTLWLTVEFSGNHGVRVILLDSCFSTLGKSWIVILIYRCGNFWQSRDFLVRLVKSSTASACLVCFSLCLDRFVFCHCKLDLFN